MAGYGQPMGRQPYQQQQAQRNFAPGPQRNFAPGPPQQQQAPYGQPQQQGYGQMQGHGQMQNNWQQDGHYQQYQHYGQQSQHYGSYGQTFQQNVFSLNPYQAFQMQSENDLQVIFNQYVSPTLHGVQSEELHKIMNDQPKIRNFYGISWSMELCKTMISMLDRNKDGIMQFPEFKELLQCLLHWHRMFKTCVDQDGSGFVEANELFNMIMTKFGYSLSKEAITVLLKRYSRAMNDGRCLIAFDDFVSVSVKLRALTEAFRARDRASHNGQETGRADMGYDDFIQCVMCL